MAISTIPGMLDGRLVPSSDLSRSAALQAQGVGPLGALWAWLALQGASSNDSGHACVITRQWWSGVSHHVFNLFRLSNRSSLDGRPGGWKVPGGGVGVAYGIPGASSARGSFVVRRDYYLKGGLLVQVHFL